MNDHGYETSIYYSLHLLLVTCCYIGQEPHCLLQGRTDTSQMYPKHAQQRLHWEWGDFWSHLGNQASKWLGFTITFHTNGIRWDVRVCLTLLIFSLGCVSRFGKWERTSQLSTTWVCSSVPVTMFPTALSAAVWAEDTQTLSETGFGFQRKQLEKSALFFYLNFDLLVAEQRDKEGDDTWVYYHLNLLITSICQIRQSPHSVYQNLEKEKDFRILN